MDKLEKKDKKFLRFAQVGDTYVEDNFVLPTEKKTNNSWVTWGTGNIYPNYIYNLYMEVPVLQSVINGICDYVVGDGVKSNIAIISDEDMEEIVRRMAMSYCLFNNIFVNVLRNRLQQIVKVIPLDARCVRSDENNENFYYSKDFADGKSYGRCKALCYPRFVGDESVDNSIYHYKNGYYSTYGLPLWASAVVACETNRETINYNFNSIKNGLASNHIVSFCNGNPTDEVKDEIEEMFYDKYTGTENACRPMINWCEDKEHSVQVDKLDSDDFGDRYTNIQKSTQQAIFTAFRCSPVLFGIPTDNNGFAQENFKDAYKLFNKTMIQPTQKRIINILNKIFDTDNAVEIIPFSIDWTDDEKTDIVK